MKHNRKHSWIALGLAVGLASVGTAAAQQQAQAAPIVRAAPGTVLQTTEAERLAPVRGTASAQPEPGVELRVAQGADARVLSSTPARTEIRVTHGVANLQVHDPTPGALVLVDLPGGQVQALKNGVYTFNAATNTVRVLQGEADAFPGEAKDAIPVKDGQQLVFAGAASRPTDFAPGEAVADLIRSPYRHGDGGGEYPGYYAPYGYWGGYPYYPYAAWGEPFYGPFYGGWGGPWGGWGYPYGGIGVGFGWGGGFRGRR